LKPFDQKRVRIALDRARARLVQAAAAPPAPTHETIIRLLANPQLRGQHAERFLVKQKDHVVVVPAEQINWIEAGATGPPPAAQRFAG
jgi:hypothetical protein